MDRYSAVTDIRFDCRADRPSWECVVLCRVIGIKEEEDEVEAREIREAGCSIVATDIMTGVCLSNPSKLSNSSNGPSTCICLLFTMTTPTEVKFHAQTEFPSAIGGRLLGVGRRLGARRRGLMENVVQR
jgi:hypothetical protein